MRFNLLLEFEQYNMHACVENLLSTALLVPELRLTRRGVRIKITETKASSQLSIRNKDNLLSLNFNGERIQTLSGLLFADGETRFM